MSTPGRDEERGLPLTTVPNFSEGRNERVIGALEATLGAHARVLNRHFDAQHNRVVYTATADPEKLAEALVAGTALAIDVIDMRRHTGSHPHIGALDVAPVVWQSDDRREDARSTAHRAGEGIAELGVPVFFYGDLASTAERTERAYFRRGGPEELARRMESGELKPDLGPSVPHPTAGATLVTAREPLVAFNIQLDTSDPEVARAVAAGIREADGGLPGVRALGLPRQEGSQVSLNIHDPLEVPLARVVAEVTRLAAEHGARPVAGELVGLAPAAALEGYPGEPPLRDFDPRRDVIENVLG
jgi:glutamate formiminotransferase / 5-formyltetrahydrofolate cyclo-ligase